MKIELPKIFAGREPVTEEEHQIVIFTWARRKVIEGVGELGLLFAIPNGGHRGKREAAMLKAAGVKSGVSDMFLPVVRCSKDGSVLAGLWIELKANGGRASPEQKQWIERMVAGGYAAKVCYGYAEAIGEIAGYLGLGEI